MQQPCVLLVDDDPSVLSSIVFALEVEDLRVEAFASGEAVLATDGPRDFACVVIDQRLPGMDGLTLLARLRGSGLLAPAILITTNPSRWLKQRVKEDGAWLIEKPLLRDSLTAAIRQLVCR